MQIELLTNNTELLHKIKPLQGVIFDIDGVFTNGLLYFTNQGEYLRAFHVQDGLGIKNLIKLGYKVGIISAKSSDMVRLRLTSLGITDCFLGCEDKLSAFKQLALQWGLLPSQIAYVGDDLPDLAPMIQAGLGVAVANGNFAVKQRADYITQSAGGNGAVREVCDLILFTHNKLEEILHYYASDPGSF